MRCPAIFGQFVIETPAQFIDCQAVRHDILRFQKTHAAIRSNSDILQGQFGLPKNADIQNIAWSQRQMLLPGSALRWMND